MPAGLEIIRNPFNQEVVHETTLESFEQIQQKIGQSRTAFKAWAQFPLTTRVAAISEALSYFEQHQEDIAVGITQEVGKPIAQSRGEVKSMIARAEHMCSIAEPSLAPVDLSQWHTDTFKGSIEYHAKGLVYIITPWNYPLFCAINGIVSALITGSTVLLKHSCCPSVGRHFENAFGNLNNIPSLLQNAWVDFETSAKVIEETDIDHVIFTGSVRGGSMIQQSIGRRSNNLQLRSPFIQCSLELGGSDPCYITESVDIATTVGAVVSDGRLHNAGQSCCAVKRAYVHEAIYDAFVQQSIEEVAKHRSGDPMDEQTTLGPLHGGDQAIDSLIAMIEDAVAKGAEVVAGGNVEQIGTARFLQPTLLTNVNHDMQVMQEETFGPVLPIMKVSSDKEALQYVNDTKYGLTASVFCQDMERAERFVEQALAGTVYVNQCNYVDARLGWIGNQHSGNSSAALSGIGLQGISRPKSINRNPQLGAGSSKSSLPASSS